MLKYIVKWQSMIIMAMNLKLKRIDLNDPMLNKKWISSKPRVCTLKIKP